MGCQCALWAKRGVHAHAIIAWPWRERDGVHGCRCSHANRHALCPYTDDYARLYGIWLLHAKDDPWYEKMQRGQTPE